MLEQKRDPDFFNDSFLTATERIEFLETSIDPNEDLYLITWSPDPKQLPDCDLYVQHSLNVRLLANYLKCCSLGVFVLESTQLGNPHYHGWYQVDDDREIGRIALVKVMKSFGPQLKITKSYGKYKFFNFNTRGNCLAYYKKDLCKYFSVQPNPIFSDSTTTFNDDCLQLINFLSPYSPTNKKLIADRLSNERFYREFYSDTVKAIN